MSVGRLGVITRVKLRIVREVPVRRSLHRLTPPAFLERMRALQAAARAAEAAGVDMRNASAVRAALPAWAAEGEAFWVPQKHEFLLVTYARADAADAAEAAEALASGFAPDASTVFATRGALLALGDLTLPADATVNVTRAQLADAQPLVAAPGGSDGGEGTRLHAVGAAEVEAVLRDAINAPLPAAAAARANNATGADPAEGATWTLPPSRPPSGAVATKPPPSKECWKGGRR